VDIFEPYEIEIKTGRTREELVDRFKERASFSGDKFYMDTQLFGLIPGSKVVGEIRVTNSWAIVSFRIYATKFLRYFSYLWLGGVGLAVLYYIIKSLSSWTYDSDIHSAIIFGTVGFVIAQLTFRTSADIQEQSIRHLIRD
jgi:hypothetical protein